MAWKINLRKEKVERFLNIKKTERFWTFMEHNILKMLAQKHYVYISHGMFFWNILVNLFFFNLFLYFQIFSLFCNMKKKV